MNSNLATDIFQICRTCTKQITSVSPFFYLNYSPAHTDLTIIQTLNNCIPELDLSIVSNAVVCGKCADAITFFYEFKQKCLELEIQIKQYMQHVQHPGGVNLVEVVRFHQPPNKNIDIKVKMEDIEITKEFKNEDVEMKAVDTTKDFKIEDLVYDTNVFNEANKDTESVERTYPLTLQKVDRQYGLFSTVENDINDSLSAVEEYSDTNSDIAKGSCSKNLNKINVYYQCYKCEHKAESRLKLTLHLKRHTPNHLEIISKKPTKNYKKLFCYRCSLCNYLTKYKCLFNFHNRTHLTKKNCRHILQHKNVLTKYFASNLQVNKVYMKADTTKYINHCYNQHSFKNRNRYREFTQNFSRHTTLKPNMRTIAAEKPFNCSICEYRSNQKKYLQSHMRTHAQEKPFSCSVCGYQCSRKYHLEQHMRTHTGEKPFSCSVCEYRCSHKQSLKQHMQTHTREKPFSCFVCEYQCSKKYHLKQHMRTHTGEKPFSCSVCEYRCSHKQSLKQHMQTHTREKPFSCFVCEYQCSKKYYLKQHMRTHTGEKPFSCSVCEYQCNHKQSLYQHIRTHKGEIFSCSVCEYQTCYKQNLKQHMRTHTGETVLCFACGYQSHCKQNLKKHMVIHTDEKLFSCSVCKYQCYRKNTLKQHMQIHTEEKPFSCAVCKYQFRSKNSLKLHLRIHTGEKPFFCYVCEYQCRRKETLMQHIRIHTGEKPFSCSVCENQFCQRTQLKRHMRTHTGEKAGKR